jgi:plasmid stabilization system protein ParE
MARLIVTDRADLDLSDIIEYLRKKAGAEVSMRYRLDINGVFERLTMFPKSGMPRRELGRHIRISVVSPYVIFYEHQEDNVTILRILDGRRNITSRQTNR